MIRKVYIYLREVQSKNWMSLKLQNAELNSLHSQLNNQDGDGASQGYAYSHCKSALHGGGRGACPWKDKTPAESKKAASTVLLRMAEGNAAAPGTVPSPLEYGSSNKLMG